MTSPNKVNKDEVLHVRVSGEMYHKLKKKHPNRYGVAIRCLIQMYLDDKVKLELNSAILPGAVNNP